MIIKNQQFAKTNTFSLSFHILFSPFFSKTHQNQDLGMGKNGVGPPSNKIMNIFFLLYYINSFIYLFHELIHFYTLILFIFVIKSIQMHKTYTNLDFR